MPQPLSTKENNLFKQVVKEYELKNYKKGVKHADQILKKHADHGETKAMKALILNSTGQTEDAFTLAKEALRNDMKSHITWHVYGLLWRSQKNFEEAIKAYKFALKIAPESQQIQRDLAWLQIQMRDYPGFLQTRKTILHDRSQIRANWTALAIAQHLSGDLASAVKTLNAYEESIKQKVFRSDMEHSEAGMYKNSILAEMGDFEQALQHLESINHLVVDRTSWMEYRARYLLELGRKDEAEEAYRSLLDRNAEYRTYFSSLEKCLGLDRTDASSQDRLVDLYQSLAEKYDKSDAARRIPLDFLSGDNFRKAADIYLRKALTKGVPSTFPNVKALYQDPAKKAAILQLVEGYATEKAANGSADPNSNSDKSRDIQKSAKLFLVLHYNYHMSRDLEKSSAMLDELLKDDPKAVDLNKIKGSILKHRGDTKKAAVQMNYARELDLKDRYINTKCAKYQLRNNQNELALDTMSKFTRNETVGGALGDLHDMQCMWFLTEDGEAYLRRGDLGLALKRFTAIHNIFDIWQEDQFDFHSFSLRKGQIRAYIDMMRWEDRLREHPFYARAAIDAIKVYLSLHETPYSNGSADSNGLDAKAKKKAAAKARKEAEKAEAERKEAEKKKKTTGEDSNKKEDQDPKGLKLVQTEKPLEDAMKFLRPLLEMTPKNIEAQILGFEVYVRRKKYILALKCLHALQKLDSNHPAVHELTVQFRLALSSAEPLPPQVQQIIDSTFTSLPASSSIPDYNNKFLSAHRSSPPHVRAALRVRHLIDPESNSQNEKDLVASLEPKDAKVTLDDVQQSLDLLKEWKSDAGVRKQVVEKSRIHWPEATILADDK